MVAYEPRLPLMAHQRAYVTASAAKPPGPDVFAALMDMGTGKSAALLYEWASGAVSGGPQDLLVFAPAGSYKNWYEDKSDLQPSELNRHLDPELRERLVDAAWVSGGGKRVRERLDTVLRLRDKKRPRALFVNVEAMSSVDAAIELCEEFVQQRGAFVVVDESTAIKGHSSRRTKTIQRVGAMGAARRIASGLWTPQSPLDLYSQCEFLDKRILRCGSYFSFRRRYAVMKKMMMGGRSVPVVVGYKNLDDLADRVAPYSYRVLKSECLDLEPKIYTTRDVELTADQRRMIKEIKHFGHAEIGKDSGRFVTTDMIIKQIMRLHQINCGFVVDDEERVLHEVPERRTDALVEVLQEHRGKAIVWAPFRYSVDKIVSRLRDEFGPQSVAQFHGGNKNTRGEEERRFLGDPACKYMVATQAAGMRGNTWVVADLVVYYANNFDLEQRDQSEDRAHRKGQTNRVTYVDLVAQDTVDARIVSALRRKIDMATLINREGYREWLV